MALRSLLSRYKSISRPSALSGGSSYSSIAKKVVSAEDAIIDDQYDSGNLSAESYLTKLQERFSRSWNTPLQTQTLVEKIRNVQQDVNDAAYSAAYQSGEITTTDMYNYEKSKLDSMTQPGSAAYIKQQQKVQGLLDKSEKEARTDARRQAMVQISEMPEDSSERLWAKYQLYDQLEQQARLDGDIDQADNLLIQKNNTLSSAKKADINDMITGVKLQTSETYGAGLGVPSAEGGQSLYSEITGSGTGISSPAVKNALESLDRQKMSLDRLYQSKSDKEAMISAYEQAVAQSSGDQKTQFQIALNNLKTDIASIDNQIANTTQNITDTVYKIQDLNSAAAASSFKQEVRKNNSQFDKAESDLENEFKAGKIDKVEYLTKGIELAQTKALYLEQASNGFAQFGDDTNAESYLEKTNQMVDVHGSLVDMAQNIDDYEPVFVDKDSNLTNLFGEKLRKGDVVLSDVRRLKDSGQWDTNYVNVDGTYHRIYYDAPEGLLDNDGFLISGISGKEANDILGNGKVYDVDDSGKVVDIPITFVKSGDKMRAVTTKDAEELQKANALVSTSNPKIFKEKSQIVQAAQNLIKTKLDEGNNREIVNTGLQGLARGQGISPILTKYVTPKLYESIGNIANTVFSNVKDFATTAIQKAKDIFGGMNIFNPPSASAKEITSEYKFVSGTPDEYKQSIIDAAEKYGVSTEILSSMLKIESNFNPNAISPAGAIGIAQIMPDTAKQLGVDPSDPAQAIDGMAKYMKQNIKTFGGDIEKAVAAYNAGAGAVSQYGGIPPYQETENYVKKVFNELKSGVTSLFSNKEVKDYTDYSTFPDPQRTRNIELALGLEKGQYRKGLQQDQGAVDKAFRSNDERMMTLLREEGLTPSWEQKAETPEVAAPIATPVPKVQSNQQSQSNQSSTPSISLPKIDLSNISQGVSNATKNATTAIKNYFTPTSNSGQNFWSTPVAQGLATVQQKVVNPITSTIKNTVSNVKNWFSNLFK